jgi:hypothetical protein
MSLENRTALKKVEKRLFGMVWYVREGTIRSDTSPPPPLRTMGEVVGVGGGGGW